MSDPKNGAQLLVRNLEAQGVEHIFGIPGAKIDPVFDALVDSRRANRSGLVTLTATGTDAAPPVETCCPVV